MQKRAGDGNSGCGGRVLTGVGGKVNGMEYRELQPGSTFTADPQTGLLLPPIQLDVSDFETDKPSAFFNRVVAEARGERHLRAVKDDGAAQSTSSSS